MARIYTNSDGTYTVQIPRGPEVYDATTGGLISEATFTADEWKAFQKHEKRGAPGGADVKLPAGLREILLLSESERIAYLQRPAPFIDASAQPLPAFEPDHPTGAPTGAAASPAAHRSPVGTPHPVSAEDAQKAFEAAEAARAKGG